MRFLQSAVVGGILGLACLATPASADPTAAKRFYVFGGLSYTDDVLSFDDNAQNIGNNFSSFSTTSHDQKGPGFQGGAGFRFSENSAIELIVMRLPSTTRVSSFTNINTDPNTGVVTTSSNQSTARIRDTSLALTWLYGVPVSQALNPYLRAGVNFTYSETKADSSDSASNFTFNSQGNSFNFGYMIGAGNDFYLATDSDFLPALRTELLVQSNNGTFNSAAVSLMTSLVVHF